MGCRMKTARARGFIPDDLADMDWTKVMYDYEFNGDFIEKITHVPSGQQVTGVAKSRIMAGVTVENPYSDLNAQFKEGDRSNTKLRTFFKDKTKVGV